MPAKYADRPTDSFDTLVTGGTGLLGRWLVPELTRRGHRVLVPIRRTAERGGEFLAWVSSHGGDASRVRVVEGDLDAPDLGLAAESLRALGDVRYVHHLGARFSWGLSASDARKTNVEGSVRIVDLASRLPSLERLVLIGGYRIADRLDADGRRVKPHASAMDRAGAYEASKHEAHRAAVERAEELSVPFSALHPSSVIGDSRTGETTQTLGLGDSILALASGRMPARVGGPNTWVPVVAVDFVATVLAEIAVDEAARGLELTLLDPRTPLLDELVDRAARRLGVRAPRLRLPLGLVRALPEVLTRTPRETLAFLDDARYPLEETEAWLASRGLAHPDFDTTFERWVSELTTNHRPSARTATRSTLPLGSVGSAASRT